MKAIIFSILIFSSLVHAQELAPIKTILDEGLKENDNAKIVYVIKRCIALNTVMANWMELKGGESMKPSVENFNNQVILLRAISFNLDNEIEKKRKLKISSTKELDAVLLNNLKNISPIYIDRLVKNYAASGSYFEKDAQLKEEITICADFNKYLSTEYGN
jgi:hypothetical protein